MTTLTPKEVSKLATDALTIAMCSSRNLKVTHYDGDISYRAHEFLEDFEDSAKAKGWTDQNKFERFEVYLILSAKDWFKLCVTKNSSPSTDWKSLTQAFVVHHLPKDRDRYYYIIFYGSVLVFLLLIIVINTATSVSSEAKKSYKLLNKLFITIGNNKQISIRMRIKV
jgi:hypothetical protein